MEDWSHSEGHLARNPIYRIEDTDRSGDFAMRFEFPSEWYEFENAGYREYAPETIQVPREVLASVRSGDRSEAVRELIERFVVIWVPDRYMPER